MAKTKILAIDDEEDILELIRYNLEKEGFKLECAETGESGLRKANAENFDLILLDLMLPGIDGLEATRRLKNNPQTKSIPIIMLTAKGEEADIVVGLELGADDYITKPFSPNELVARVRTVLRRSESAIAETDLIRIADLTLDVPRLRLTVGDHPIELTTTEFQRLTTLARQPGRIFTRSQLLDAVHGIAFESYERAIDAHIKNIRRKIEPNPREPRYILTVYGMGYRFADE
jgi:DNA-binding response OmpR family regulator